MKKWLLAACLGIGSQAVLGASITSVTQSEKADAKGYYTIDIEGTGFGSGPTIVLFDDFENQTANQPVDFGKALIGKWRKSTSYSLVPKVVEYDNGKGFNIRDLSQSGTQSIAQVEAEFGGGVSTVFISYSVFVPEGRFFSGANKDFTFPDVSSWKFTWITDTPDGISSHTKFNLCAPQHSGKGTFTLIGNSVNHGYTSMADSWSWHTKNYISFGMLANPEKPKELPGHLVFQVTGKKDHALIHNKTDKPIFPETNTTSFDRVKFPGWFGSGDQKNFEAYYDDIYVATGANALARVELSDHQALKSSVVNQTLPTTSWSPTRITAKVHKSNLAKLGTPCIRVYDSKNESITQPLKPEK